ncbi:Uncharacterised protein [Vibrio cholerae]|nr:Uncharacterised protein [Vibrio cholerae]
MHAAFVVAGIHSTLDAILTTYAVAGVEDGSVAHATTVVIPSLREMAFLPPST